MRFHRWIKWTFLVNTTFVTTAGLSKIEPTPCYHDNHSLVCRYLESQINEGAGREIRCPGYQCYKLVPEVTNVYVIVRNVYLVSCGIVWHMTGSNYFVYVTWQEVIRERVSADQLQKYSDLNIKQFVESSSDIRWCPFPDCSYAICIRGKGGVSKSTTPPEGEGGVAGDDDPTPGLNVECGRGHGFCW